MSADGALNAPAPGRRTCQGLELLLGIHGSDPILLIYARAMHRCSLFSLTAHASDGPRVLTPTLSPDGEGVKRRNRSPSPLWG